MYQNTGVGSWVARRARMTPGRTALCFDGHELTYAQLDARIQRLACAFQARGIGAGKRVAVLAHNHPAILETLFACARVGAAMVPLHPGFDVEALQQAVDRVRPDAWVVTAELLPLAQRLRTEPRTEGAAMVPRFTTGPSTGVYAAYEDLLESSSAEPLDHEVDLEQACVIAFSSGTTGPSKAVPLTHANLLFNALNTLTAMDYVQDDVLLVSAPLYRMGGLGFCLAMLLKGGCCVLQARADPQESLSRIARHRVSVLFDGVQALEALASAPRFASADLRSLRLCATGGSYVPASLATRFHARGLTLQSGYGLTEAAPLALILDRREAHAHPGASGRPVLFCAARVVDGQLRDLPPGQVGELLLHGPNITAGYLDDPDANARAFHGGWLRTGDAALQHENGLYTVIGRMADALALNGQIVHPAPIEAALSALEPVRECAIVQTRRESCPQVFLVLTPAAAEARSRALSACRRALGPRLARYQLHCVAALPRNPNGKVLHEQLRRGVPPNESPRHRSEPSARGRTRTAQQRLARG